MEVIEKKVIFEKETSNVEFLKNYINEQLTARELDENKQIKIDFSGLGEFEEIKRASNQLGFQVSEAEGQGVYWLYR